MPDAVLGYRRQVEQARRTSRRVLGYAALSFVGGWLIVVACVLAWRAFGVPLDQALDVFLAIGLGSVLAGVGLYATARSLDISASRLEIDIATKLAE